MKIAYNILIGFVIGIGTMFFILKMNNRNSSFKYIKLEEDYNIENVGKLKKGTVLRIDQPMSEGFTRYIMYLNLKSSKTSIYVTGHKDEIIPYWLQPSDTTTQRQ